MNDSDKYLLTPEEIKKIWDEFYYKNQSFNAGMRDDGHCDPEDMMIVVAQRQVAKVLRMQAEERKVIGKTIMRPGLTFPPKYYESEVK